MSPNNFDQSKDGSDCWWLATTLNNTTNKMKLILNNKSNKKTPNQFLLQNCLVQQNLSGPSNFKPILNTILPDSEIDESSD